MPWLQVAHVTSVRCVLQQLPLLHTIPFQTVMYVLLLFNDPLVSKSHHPLPQTESQGFEQEIQEQFAEKMTARNLLQNNVPANLLGGSTGRAPP